MSRVGDLVHALKHAVHLLIGHLDLLDDHDVIAEPNAVRPSWHMHIRAMGETVISDLVLAARAVRIAFMAVARYKG